MRKTIMVAVVSAVVGALVAVPVAVYASHSFTDVPDSNTFHEDIAWLADAGVTKGCNPPANTEFCPKDAVTREQMAAFMHRLADNQVVDAGSLRGYAAEDLAPRASYATKHDVAVHNPGGPLPSSWALVYTDISAPKPGMLIVQGRADFEADAVTNYECYMEIVGSDMVDGSLDFPGVEVWLDPTTNPQDSCSTAATLAVPASDIEVQLWIDCDRVDCLPVLNTEISAIWLPFDGNGETPAPSEYPYSHSPADK